MHTWQKEERENYTGIIHASAVPLILRELHGGWSQSQLTFGERRGTSWTGQVNHRADAYSRDTLTFTPMVMKLFFSVHLCQEELLSALCFTYSDGCWLMLVNCALFQIQYEQTCLIISGPSCPPFCGQTRFHLCYTKQLCYSCNCNKIAHIKYFVKQTVRWEESCIWLTDLAANEKYLTSTSYYSLIIQFIMTVSCHLFCLFCLNTYLLTFIWLEIVNKKNIKFPLHWSLVLCGQSSTVQCGVASIFCHPLGWSCIVSI